MSEEQNRDSAVDTRIKVAGLEKDVAAVQTQFSSIDNRLGSIHREIMTKAPRWVVVILIGTIIGIGGMLFVEMKDLSVNIGEINTSLKYIQQGKRDLTASAADTKQFASTN